MVDLRRSVKCSHCGNESEVVFSSGLEVKEMLFAGKCNTCGSTVQLNYSVVESTVTTPSASPLEQVSVESADEGESDSSDNYLEEAFSGESEKKKEKNEFPSDALKDLMG